MKKLFTLFLSCVFISLHAQTIYQHTVDDQFAYYECSNMTKTYVKFKLPDSVSKRLKAIKLYNCKPMPKAVMVCDTCNPTILGEVQ